MAEIITLAKFREKSGPKARVLTSKEIEYLKQNYKLLSLRQMGEKLGVSHATVKMWLREYGINVKMVPKKDTEADGRYFNVHACVDSWVM